MSPSPRILHGVFWLVTERLLRLAATVPVTLLIARSLGPADFGRLGYALGVTGIAVLAGQLGMDRLLRRDFAAQRNAAGASLRSAFLLSGAASALSCIGLCLFAFTTIGDPLTARLIYLLAFGVLPQFLLPAEYWFQATGHLARVTLGKFLVLLLCAALRVWVCLDNGPVEWLAAITVLEWSLSALFVYLLFRRSPDRPPWQPASRHIILSWSRENWSLFVLALLSACFDRFDIIVLNHRAAELELGYYTAAQRFSELILVLSTTAAASVLPWLTKHKLAGEESYRRRLQWYFDASLAAPLLIALLATLLAHLAVILLFGERFLASGNVLVLLCWTAPAIYTEVARSQYLVAERLVKFDALFNVLQALCFIPLAWFLSGRWGAIGVAGAKLLSASLSCWVLPFLFTSTRQVAWLQLRAFTFPVRLPEMLRQARAQLPASLRRQ